MPWNLAFIMTKNKQKQGSEIRVLLMQYSAKVNLNQTREVVQKLCFEAYASKI
jgi:hypothetical protein